MIDLSVVILSFDTQKLLLECLASVEREVRRPDAKLESEVIVVDNGSRDGSPSAVREVFPWVNLIELEKNLGYARGNNVGLRRARGHVVALINSDVVLKPGAVERAMAALENHPSAGVAGIQLFHPDGRPQNSIHVAPSLFREFVPTWLLETLAPARYPSKRRPAREPIQVDSVSGAVLFVKREVFDRVGLLPEDYFFFLEETDWCWQMRRAGLAVLHVPDAHAIHHLGASSKQKDPIATRIEYQRSLDHFLRKHRGLASANAVRIVRFSKGIAAIFPLAVLSLVSSSHRARLGSTARLVLWQISGRPASWGLSELGKAP